MRIGLITGEYPPMQGGVGAFTHELAHALVEQGHKSFVLTNKRVPTANDGGIDVSGQVDSWNRASLFSIYHWAQANRLDVVNIQYEAAAYQMAQLVPFLPRLLGDFPTITTFHDLLVPYLFPKAGGLRFRVVLDMAQRSKGVIVTNPQDEQRLKREKHIAPIRNIPIGSNISATLPPGYERDTWRAKLNLPDDALLVGYFGFLNASKGIDTLLEATAKAIEQHPNLYLRLIGGRTGSSDPTNVAYAEQIDKMIEKLGLQARIRWTGFVEGQKVSANLTACDMVALPYKDGVSFRRGSFMAAIAHGCAIITTRPEVELPEVRDSIQALLIPPERPDALAAAILKLAENPALRSQLQANARELAARFTWDKIAAQTVAFFKEMLGAARR
jgi:glycosyltransferase involved in cell wall biosynthesis